MLLLLAALCWGISFPIQVRPLQYLHPFAINAIKSLLGGVVLTPLIVYLNKGKGAKTKKQKHTLFLAGVVCGVLVLAGSIFQQMGIAQTSAGKAGFMTTLYVIFVPILGLFFRRRVSTLGWIGVALATAGLYLLCMKDSFTLAQGDVYLLICAVIYAVHILAVGHFSTDVNPVDLARSQFWVSGIISLVLMLLFARPTVQAVITCIPELLYLGIISSALAFSLQVIGQRDTSPMVASLILSLESVFAAVTGALFLGERMSGRELLGCAIMFLALVLAQLPSKKESDSRFLTDEELLDR